MRRIGEVAAATGLTVRTLHHSDEIGLLAPSARSASGYRLYADDDVRRLYRTVAFRRLACARASCGCSTRSAVRTAPAPTCSWTRSKG
jgi:DNA-binding transcriptional MerR regulator